MALRRNSVALGAIVAIALGSAGSASAASLPRAHGPIARTERGVLSAAVTRLAATRVAPPAGDGGVHTASLCWERDYTDPVADAPIDAIAYRLTYDCQTAFWHFNVTLAAPLDTSRFDSVATEIDTDDDPSTGCDGFDVLVAGVFDNGTPKGVVAATPTCDSSTWTTVGAATFAWNGTSLSLAYSEASLGNADRIVWNAGVVPKAATDIVDDLPDHGVLVADEFLQQTGAHDGYWLVDAAGGVHAYGSARFRGDLAGTHLSQPIVGMASKSDRGGYWLLGRDGGVFTFGHVSFYGSTGALHLNRPVVAMNSTMTGHGYWFVGSDGGVFSFGDAAFYGSTGAIHLNQPIVGMASTPSGKGYWLVAADGGIFSFGDAAFYGSTGAIHLVSPIVGMTSSRSGNGYRFVAADGGIFSFGDAAFYGGLGGGVPPSPVVGMG
ncbi:MAG: hypothetical protein QOF28_3152 [Actinomycetota bacterium]|nr:hypothetical protein [Actinomycetota bacterium]